MALVLICFTVVFVAGAILTLERRCLGQMALVQPLVLCGLAGLLSGQEAAGIWIGITLQLLAHGYARDADWPLAGVAAALVLLIGPHLGLIVEPGDPSALIAVALPAVAAIAAHAIERRLARSDGDAFQRGALRDTRAPVESVERFVRRRIIRGLVLGGVETIVVGGVAILAATVLSRWAGGGEAWRALVRVSLPTVSAAVALGALADQRLLGLTAFAFVVTLTQAVLS